MITACNQFVLRAVWIAYRDCAAAGYGVDTVTYWCTHAGSEMGVGRPLLTILIWHGLC